MTFNDVIEDIKKLSGLTLQSIRPGSNITILDVDEEHDCVILRTSQGTTKSRPLGELQRIWAELNKVSAVHVDGVLNGSGSSRNQPETILANLPYVEWLQLNGKKHIAFVGKNTHPYGTLRKMDAVVAQDVAKIMSQSSQTSAKIEFVVVSSDLSASIASLQSIIAGTVSTVLQGVYVFEGASVKAWIISQAHSTLLPGTYTVLHSSSSLTGRKVSVADEEFFVIDSHNLKLLIKK